jgi:hypothetical protein
VAAVAELGSLALTIMDALNHRREAEKLLNYFHTVGDGMRERDRAHWDRGMQMCERWIKLIGSTEVTEGMIESYLDDIYSEPSAGSGWYELSFQFKKWARSRGFSANDRTYAKP